MGVRNPESATMGRNKHAKPKDHKSKEIEKESVEGSESTKLPGWSDADKPPQFHNLQLLLRLCTAVARLQARKERTCNAILSSNGRTVWCQV